MVSTEREQGYYWARLGLNVPEVALWESGAWWLCGNPLPWIDDAVTLLSERLLPRPPLHLVKAWRDAE